MSSINQVAISGHLGRDAELQTTQSGFSYCTFSVAVTDPKKNDDGSWGEYVNWVNVTIWGNRAEALAPILAKGTKVAVSGKLHYRSWETEDGKRSMLDVTANEIVLLGAGGQDGSSGVEKTVKDNFNGANVSEYNEEDIPF